MPTNVLLQNSYGAGLEDRRRNALLDQQMQAQEQAMQQQARMGPLQAKREALVNEAQSQANRAAGLENALGIVQTVSRGILGSPSPKQAAAQALSNPQFTDAMQFIGVDLGQFQITPEDTDQSIASEIQQFLGQFSDQPRNVLPAELQTFQGLTDGMSPEDIDQARRIQLGLDSRAGTTRILDVGGVPTLVENTAQGPRLTPVSSLSQEQLAAFGLSNASQAGTEAAETAAIPERARVTAQAEAEVAAPQREQAIQQSLANVETTLSLLDDALGGVNAWTAGPIGAVLENIAGTPAADLQATVDTIVANLSFDRLQQMRESSKTGGALGAISERELTLLGAAVANLSNSQSPAQQIRNLRLVREHYGNIRNQMQRNINEQRQLQGLPTQNQGNAGGPAQIQDDAQYDALPSGTQFIGPDGVLRVKP